MGCAECPRFPVGNQALSSTAGNTRVPLLLLSVRPCISSSSISVPGFSAFVCSPPALSLFSVIWTSGATGTVANISSVKHVFHFRCGPGDSEPQMGAAGCHIEGDLLLCGVATLSPMKHARRHPSLTLRVCIHSPKQATGSTIKMPFFFLSLCLDMHVSS